MVLHIVAAIDVEHAGPSYSVPALCEALIARGVATTLAVLDWMASVETRPYVKRFPLGVGPRKLGRSPAMARWLIEEARAGRVEILHNHGLWMMPNVYPGWARRRSGCRLVVSPRGTVSTWALGHRRFKKKLFGWLLQNETLKRADAFHATADSEYEDLRRLGYRQPICILPNGVYIPPLIEKRDSGRRTLLYLGRIHKKKGIDLLLHAWAVIESRFPSWDLVIAGPDDGGYLVEYRVLAHKLKLTRVSFVGPLYGEDKLAAYRKASIYVLPTHSENFGITVAEALAAGTPAIVTRGAPWRGLEEHESGWWIDIGVDPLVATLEEALALPDARLRTMGLNGRAWMTQEFAWTAIAEQMAQFYSWLKGRAPQPACVRVD